MFRTSKRKIVAAIMLIFIFVLAGTFTVTYLASYKDVYDSNQEKISHYIAQYELHGNPSESGQTAPPGDRDDTAYQLATFYSVALSTDGTVLSVDCDSSSTLPQKDLISIAQNLISSGKEKGSSGAFDYQVVSIDDYTLVVLIDNTLLSDNVILLLRNSLIWCSCTLVVLFVFSIFLAKWIVKPLEDSYEKQKQFISDAGHELKTPLAVVRANTELLERELGDNKWLSNIVFENERMTELVNQLLTLARTEQTAPVMEEVDFSRIVTGCALPFEGIAFEQGLALCCDVEEHLKLSGNRGQLEQLVSILVDNAIFHAKPNTEVHVSLKKEKHLLQLAVSNQGKEIPPEKREQIFERFYRNDESRTSTAHRYGLGLAIAKAVTLSHKGKIRVDCAQGWTTFYVTFPGSK